MIMLYISSTEYEKLKGPFNCIILNNVFINKRQVLLVEINPVLSGIDYGIGFSEIKYLFLLAKYKDSEIKKMNRFPIDVIVFIPEDLNNPFNNLKSWKNMNSIGWAELHKIV